MPRSNTAMFYTTEHCALCDEALDYVLGASELLGWTLQAVDISVSERLMEQYGDRVPVLALNGCELEWPFDSQDLSRATKPE